MEWTQWLGYCGSTLVALSFTMRSLVKLRWINLAGAVIFVVYGLIIDALPIAFLNLFIVATNLYYLRSIYYGREQFHFVQVPQDAPVVTYWLEQYRDDIQRFFPRLDEQLVQSEECFVLMRNSEPVGILLGYRRGNSYQILLDYVFPRYRDFKTGDYLYHQSDLFVARGVERLSISSDRPAYKKYLLRMGFIPSPDQPGTFIYILTAGKMARSEDSSLIV